MLLLQVLAAVLAALLAALLLPPPRLPAGVPHVPGAPLLGSLPGFARDTAGWLRHQAAAHGSAFAAHLLRGPCLFLTNAADFPGVWRRTRELSFHEVELDMNKKVVGLAPLACEAAVDAHAHSLWTRHLSGAALPQLASSLAEELATQASGKPGSVAAAALGPPDRDGWRSCGLYDLVYRLLWAAGMRAVVGGLSRDEVAALIEPFRAFDDGFPMLAGGLPPALLGKAVTGRRAIAAAMLTAVRRGETSHSDAPALGGLVRDRAAHFRECGVSDADAAALNGLLAWPLHANSAPAAFWALAHTISNAGVLADVQAEVDAFVSAHPGYDDGSAVVALTPALLDAALPLTSACCLEALRLAGSSFGLRIATEAVEVPLSPHGGRPARVAAISPGTRVFLASLGHYDDARFPEASLFRPRRFLPGGGASPGDVLAFGGGASMCPGRHFALMELRLIRVALLSRWQLRLPEQLPPLHAQRAGLGVLPPQRDVRAQARLRRTQTV